VRFFFLILAAPCRKRLCSLTSKVSARGSLWICQNRSISPFPSIRSFPHLHCFAPLLQTLPAHRPPLQAPAFQVSCETATAIARNCPIPLPVGWNGGALGSRFVPPIFSPVLFIYLDSRHLHRPPKQAHSSRITPDLTQSLDHPPSAISVPPIHPTLETLQTLPRPCPQSIQDISLHVLLDSRTKRSTETFGTDGSARNRLGWCIATLYGMFFL